MSLKTFFNTHEKSISWICMLAVFLGMIRSLSEPFRLQHYSALPLSFQQVKPFLLGSLVAAIGLLGMFIFSQYNRYRFIMFIAMLTILSMMIIKFKYQV